MTITRLDDDTVRKIAAGEVVERPASVVKELIENSLDAGATRIDVGVEAGGTDRVRVADDGEGMTREEVKRAVEEHTTSKIDDVEDLEAGVATLGFRGEALHAISAVTKTTITTRPRGGDRATELTIDHGEVTAVAPAGRPEGTTVDVTDLFRETPARRKFLKTESTEFDHVNRIVSRYALANPDVAVSLVHDDRETFATTGQGDLESAILSAYGREVAESMISIDHEPPDDAPIDRIRGFVSHPETTRSTRAYVSTYVNDRYVAASILRRATVDAYGGQLAADRYPFAIVFVDMPADSVDVNVHPRKMEVRWTNEEAVKKQVQTAVEDALRQEGILRSSAPRGRSAPEQTEIEPSSVSEDADESETGSIETAERDRTLKSEADRTDTVTRDVDTSKSDGTDSSRTSSSESSSTTHSGTLDTSSQPSSRSSVDSSSTQKTLSGDDAHETTEFDTVPDLRVLGQLHDTYIIAEADDGLILIDQHAADERINYERLRDRFEGDTTTQALTDPVELELTASEAALFDTYQGALARFGFHAKRVDDRTVEVTTVPALVAEAAGASVIRDVLSDMVGGEDAAADTVEAIADDLLSDMACHPSITGNTSLTDGSVVDLLSALDDCENPWACPHGRPVIIHVDSDEIDDRFERDYPGGH
ncbi:MAG: DNA mismatch repair endonuclease MutL [Halobacteriales archaeon]